MDLNFNRFYKRYGSFFLVLFACFFISSPCWGKTLKIRVTTPWLASFTSFIGGVNVKVIPMTKISSKGNLVRLKLQKEQIELPSVALDHKEAIKFGLNVKDPKVFTLYSSFPLEGKGVYYTDPSVLPFLTQKILVVLAQNDPKRYWYYQRRLAEFQARLETTLTSGRKILKGGRLLDFTGQAEMLFIAAGCSVTEGTDDMRRHIRRLLKIKAKEEEIEALFRSWLADVDFILVREPYDKKLEKVLSKMPEVIYFRGPRPDSDFLSDIYNYYLSAWNVMRGRG